MLDKINNITSGGDYAKSVKPQIFNSVLGAAYRQGIDSHDSADISPAFKYLTQVHWRLKGLKFNAEEKVYLSFILSGIEFQLSIDLLNFSKLTSLNYHLSKEGGNGVTKKKITADINTKVEWIDYNKEPELLNLSAINVFFNRVLEQNIYSALTEKDDKYFFEDLLDGIMQGIRDEFNHLNNQVFIFFDKLTGKRIPNNPKINDDYTEPVIINKIKIFDA